MFHAFFEKAAVFGRHVFCLHSGKTNIAGWKMDPDWRYFSYWTTVIFQPVMLVYQRVPCDIISQWSIPHPGCQSPPGVWHYFSRGVPIYNCPSPSIFVIVSQTPDPRCCQRPGTYTPGANWMNHGGGVIFFGTLTEKKKSTWNTSGTSGVDLVFRWVVWFWSTITETARTWNTGVGVQMSLPGTCEL